MTIMGFPPPVIDESDETNLGLDVESDCNHRVNSNKQLMDATSLFQPMMTVISKEDTTPPTSESLLKLVNRNKLSEKVRSMLDDAVSPLQDTAVTV
jgi:hypothetical protein